MLSNVFVAMTHSSFVLVASVLLTQRHHGEYITCIRHQSARVVVLFLYKIQFCFSINQSRNLLKGLLSSCCCCCCVANSNCITLCTLACDGRQSRALNQSWLPLGFTWPANARKPNQTRVAFDWLIRLDVQSIYVSTIDYDDAN